MTQTPAAGVRTANANANSASLQLFTSLFLVLIRTNLTLLRLPIPLVDSTSSTAKQPTVATASAVQTTLDEDDELFSKPPQHYCSQTIRAVIFTSTNHNLAQFRGLGALRSLPRLHPQSSPGTPLTKG